MAKLWRSVFVVALCLAAVIGLRVYLGRQIEIARSSRDHSTLDRHAVGLGETQSLSTQN
jgi:hypothetical protein